MGVDISIVDEEIRGSGKRETESLMPPASPKTIKTVVHDTSPGSPCGRIIPSFSSQTKYLGTEKETATQRAEFKHHFKRNDDRQGTDDLSDKPQCQRRVSLQMGRKGVCIRPKNVIRVLHHDDFEDVEEKVAYYKVRHLFDKDLSATIETFETHGGDTSPRGRIDGPT